MADPVVVMPTNCTGTKIRELAAAYPNTLAHLMPVGGWRQPFLPYALDNGAFGAFTNNRPWDEAAFFALLDKAAACEESPLWVVVPDVVTDAKATKEKWAEWAPRLRDRHPGWPLAFAVQDGMTYVDVPKDADVVFVGGSTAWKWIHAPHFCWAHPRVHVGRVNTYRLLWKAMEAGAESCDGTGWLRGDQRQIQGLEQFLKEFTAGHRRHPQYVLLDDDLCGTPLPRGDGKGWG